jgi:enoyl-CoA hydratase/carnithine racemase
MSKGVGMAVGPMTSFGGLKTIAATLVDGGILRLGLNRPKVNAINLQLLEDMRDAFALAAASKDVKGVLVASNNPKCFSAGLDLAELYGHITAGNRDALEHFAFTTMTPAFLGPSKCPKPVAAAVDGHAIAGLLALLRGKPACLHSACAWMACRWFNSGPGV